MITDWSKLAQDAYEVFTKHGPKYTGSERDRQDMANSLALMQFMATMAVAEQLSMLPLPSQPR